MSDPLTINDLRVSRGLGHGWRIVTPAEFADIARREGWVKLVDIGEPSDQEIVNMRTPDRFGPCRCHRCRPPFVTSEAERRCANCVGVVTKSERRSDGRGWTWLDLGRSVRVHAFRTDNPTGFSGCGAVLKPKEEI